MSAVLCFFLNSPFFASLFPIDSPREEYTMSLISRLTSSKFIVPVAVGTAAVAATLAFSTLRPLANEPAAAFKGDDQWIDLKVSFPPVQHLLLAYQLRFVLTGTRPLFLSSSSTRTFLMTAESSPLRSHRRMSSLVW